MRSAGVSGAALVLAAADLDGVLVGTGVTDLVGVVVLTAVGFAELADFFAGDAMTILQVTGLYWQMPSRKNCLAQGRSVTAYLC
jgi:hypothetical protein